MLKKLFASVSAFAVVFASVAPMAIAAPSVTDPELLDAVTWAYDAGLTKYSDANTFMPFNNLTREQAAKFASEFAETVLNLEADSTRTTVCEYKDASIMDATLVDSVTKACQQSIMMGYQGNFMPKQLLTRGQFATMVSRMLGGIDAMSTEQAHFDYLKDLGIMNVASLTSTITRGDAMLMLYRVANGSSSDLCAIDPNLPGCSGTVTPIVKKGDLNVALNPASPVNYSSIPNVAKVTFGKVDFTAGSDDITLISTKLTRKGLGLSSDLKKVNFEKDGIRVSSSVSVNSDNEAVLTFVPALVITAGKTVTLDLVANVSWAVGSEYQFASVAIESSAKNLVGGFTTPILRTASYAVSSVKFVGSDFKDSYPVDSSTSVKMAQFTLSDSLKDVSFKGVTLYNSGSADNAYLGKLEIYRGTTLVSSSASINGRYVYLGTKGDLIKKGTSATYTVKATINNADQLTDKYGFSIKKTEDINVVESDTSYATTITGTIPALVGVISIEGADLRFTTLWRPTTVTVVPGATNVELFSGSVMSKADISLENLTIEWITYTSGTQKLSDFTNTVYAQIGNTVYSVSTEGLADKTKLEFEGPIFLAANTTYPVRVYADIRSMSPAGDFNFRESKINLEAFKGQNEYTATEETVTSSLGSIYGNKIVVAEAKLRLSTSKSAIDVVKWQENVTVANATFSTTTDTKIAITAFDLTLSGGTTGQASINRFDGGLVVANMGTTTIAQAEIKSGSDTLTFNLTKDLEIVKGTDAKITFVLDNVSRDVAKGDNVVFTVDNVKATETTNQKVVTVTAQKGNTINVVWSPTVKVSTSTSTLPQLLIAGGEAQTIWSFKLTSEDSSSTVKDLTLAISGEKAMVDQLENLKIYAGTTLIPTAYVEDADPLAGTILIKDVNYDIPADTTVTFNVKADVAGELLANNVFDVSLSTGLLETLAGDDVTNWLPTAKKISSTIDVVKSKPVIAVKGIKELWNSVSYEFTITPTAGTTIDLTQLAAKVTSTYSGTMGAITLESAEVWGNVYGTITNGGLSNITPISISETTTLFINVAINDWTSSSDTPFVKIGLTDFSYKDGAVHNGILSSFYNAIAWSANLYLQTK